MIKHSPSSQLSIEAFRTPFEVHLDKANRWVKLASIIPWDKLAGIYYQSMSTDKGAPSIDARIVIGALIIKHKLKLNQKNSSQLCCGVNKKIFATDSQIIKF